MKCLFNCTTNIVGGGVKNAALFIRYALKDKEIKWVFAVSWPVKKILEDWGLNSEKIFLFRETPSHNIKARKKLKKYSEEFKVDLVYTMAGPAYVDFKMFHIMGISNPYITHAKFFDIAKTTSVLKIFRRFMLLIYHSFYALKANLWVFQTQTSKKGFCRRFKVDEKKTIVVPNAVDTWFVRCFDKNEDNKLFSINEINVFCPAAAYSHKGLQFIPGIAKELRIILGSEIKVKFILTIDINSSLWKKVEKAIKRHKVNDIVVTIGSFIYSDAVELYREADIIFVPSLIETFTVSYLEAFAANKPLVAANKKFSIGICKEAAVYINPYNARDAAEVIKDLILDKNKRQYLVRRGKVVLSKQINQFERYNKIKECLKKYNKNINGK